jgi:hypothetical protein
MLWTTILRAVEPECSEPIASALAEAAYTIGSTKDFQTILARLGLAIEATTAQETRLIASASMPAQQMQSLAMKAGEGGTLFHATLDNLDWSTGMNGIHIITRFIWIQKVSQPCTLT